MSPVKDADPQATELDDAFREAMNAPARPREAAPPPDVDHDAPHGRGDDGQPLAPYGYTKDGKPKRSPAGRKPADEKPRTGEVVRPGTPGKGSPKPQEMPEPADYSQALSELADAIWLGLNGLAMGGPHIPVIGKFIPGEKIGAEAYIWKANKGNLVKAMQTAADHNAKAARTCARLSTGDITWVITAGALAMPFFAQTAAVMKGDEALQQLNPDASVKALANLNKAEMEAYVGQLREMAEAAAAEAMAGQDLPSRNGQHPEAAA